MVRHGKQLHLLMECTVMMILMIIFKQLLHETMMIKMELI